ETLYRYRERLFNDVRQTVVIHIGDIEQYRFRGQSCRRHETAVASAEELKQRVRKRSGTDDSIVDGKARLELAVWGEVCSRRPAAGLDPPGDVRVRVRAPRGRRADRPLPAGLL